MISLLILNHLGLRFNFNSVCLIIRHVKIEARDAGKPYQMAVVRPSAPWGELTDDEAMEDTEDANLDAAIADHSARPVPMEPPATLSPTSPGEVVIPMDWASVEEVFDASDAAPLPPATPAPPSPFDQYHPRIPAPTPQAAVDAANAGAVDARLPRAGP